MQQPGCPARLSSLFCVTLPPRSLLYLIKRVKAWPADRLIEKCEFFAWAALRFGPEDGKGQPRKYGVVIPQGK